jgi:hypothetical protein
MAISYQAALRILAKEKGGFTVPKKGSDDYAKVRKMMEETEMSAEHEIKKRVGVKRTAVDEKASNRNVKGVRTAGLKAKGGASMEAPPPMKVDTVLIDQPVAVVEDSKKIVKKVASKPMKAAKGGVRRDGKTKQEDLTDEVVNTNTGVSAVISSQNAGQKKQIEKALKKKGPTMEVKADPAEQTIDHMNKDATGPAVDGDAQFNFTEFRKMLLC